MIQNMPRQPNVGKAIWTGIVISIAPAVPHINIADAKGP